MANNFHDINGWHIVGIEGHNGLLLPFCIPMWFWKLTFLHPFVLGPNQKPTVMFNGVPSVVHNHEPPFLWAHIGIIPGPLDLLTPLHIAFGSHKCWLPRGAVEICGEKATCCVIAGPVSLNADCWEYGKWPTSLVLNPGTVQTTPTFMDFLMGAATLALDLLMDLAFEGLMMVGGKLLKSFGDRFLQPLFRKGKELFERGMKSAMSTLDDMASGLSRGLRSLGDRASDALAKAKCFFTGHPVDAASGSVVDWKVDLQLPGAIPLSWERSYSSARALERTGLGRGGWTHSLEQWVEPDAEGLVLRDEQGRDITFPPVAPGDSHFHRAERLTLTAHDGGRVDVYNHKTRLTRRFEPAAPAAGAPADGPPRALLRSIDDAFGNTISLSYSGERLVRVIDTAGREIRVKTTAGGRIVRLEVWAGDDLQQWVDYAYAKMGELASATDALGASERYEYDEDHRMVKTTLKNGVSFFYWYDPQTGRCTKTWGDDGLHTVALQFDVEKRVTRLELTEEPRVLSFDEDGLLLREETPDGILLRTREYDADQYLLAEANGAGETTRHEYDAHGNKTREIDPAGNVTEWQYAGDLPVVRVDPGGLVTTYRYDPAGSLVDVAYPSEARYSMSYDARGHLVELRGAEGRLAGFETDAHHDVTEQVDARGAKTTFAHDRLGRPTLRTDALGRTSEVLYDLLGHPVASRRPDGTRSEVEYDALGLPARVTDALGQVSTMEHAGTGTLQKLVLPDGAVWRFKYTPAEKLRRIENPRGEAYEFAYDTAGRVVKETTFDGRVMRYSYSPAGRIRRIDYPDGSFRAFEHDPLGNVVGEESTDGPITFRRDTMGRLLGAALEQDGRKVVTLFERDRLGRVVAETQDGRHIRHELDALGRQVARTMPDGTVTRYRYDALGRLTGLSHAGHEVSFDRDVLGRESARRDNSGNVTIHREYDSMDRIIEQRTEVRAPGGGAPTAAIQRLWQYDVLGRVKQVEDQRWGSTRYRHDPVGNLVEARRGGRLEVFAYDAAASIQGMLAGLDTGAEPAAAQERESADAAPATWEIAPGNRLLRTDETRYSYDRRGRRILAEQGDGGPGTARSHYVWDCRDRLLEVRQPSGAKVTFTYDAFGRRVHKESRDEYGEIRRSVDFLWDGNLLAADIDARHGTRTFVHEPGTFVPVLQVERGEVFSVVVDHVGVPRELVDQKGRVAWSAAHSAWGAIVEAHVDPARAAPAGSSGGRPIECPFRLLGQYADEETGLCYTRFRYFDPQVGRWCSPDPLGIFGGKNLFGGPPPSFVTDPLGLAVPFEVGTMASLNQVGDNLDRHELLQNAWLVEQGASGGRGSSIGKQNPAIALAPDIHQTVTSAQATAGLHDTSKLAAMTAQQNIDANSKILRDALVTHGMNPADADAVVARIKGNAETFADGLNLGCMR